MILVAYPEKGRTQESGNESLKLYLLLKEGKIMEFNGIREQKVNMFIDYIP